MDRVDSVPSSDSDLESYNHTPKKYSDDSPQKDTVILLNGHRLKKCTSASYRKISFNDGSTSYVLNDEYNTSKYINYGNVKRNDSSEYFVAFINKRTKEIIYEPANLVKLQPQVVENKDNFFKGKIINEIKPDYTKNNGIGREDFLGKRNALTLDFGSIKKRKMLDDVVKRSVDQDTMIALADTAFASNTNVDEKPNLNQSGVEALTAIGGTTQGDVAPRYNTNGKKPLEIWPIEQFFDDSTYDIVSGDCIEFFQDKSFENLLELGFPRLIAELANSHVKDGQIEKSCKNLRTIDLRKVPCSMIPEVLVTQVNSEFFNLRASGRTGYIRFNTATMDKLASHILILYMLLNKPTHGIFINVASKQFHISELQMNKYLTKLGCIINKATSEQEINYGVTRIGVIKNVPGPRAFASRKRR